MDNIFDNSMISGTWMDTRTGRTVQVVNCVADGDNMIVITSDDKQLNMEDFSRYFVQSDDIEQPQQETEQSDNTQNIALLSEEDRLLLQGKQPVINNSEQVQQDNKQDISPNNIVLEKFFNKISTKPTINISIDWPDLSYEKLNLFIDMLDISTNDICGYIKRKYIDDIDIVFAIDEFLKKKLNK